FVLHCVFVELKPVARGVVYVGRVVCSYGVPCRFLRRQSLCVECRYVKVCRGAAVGVCVRQTVIYGERTDFACGNLRIFRGGVAVGYLTHFKRKIPSAVNGKHGGRHLNVILVAAYVRLHYL